MNQKELTCIGCPMGCLMSVSMEDGQWMITGNTCQRGEAYAKKELTNPTRILTTTVRLCHSSIHALPVKTSADIPKGKMAECIRALKEVVVTPPVAAGDVILRNAAGTGVDIVATLDV